MWMTSLWLKKLSKPWLSRDNRNWQTKRKAVLRGQPFFFAPGRDVLERFPRLQAPFMTKDGKQVNKGGRAENAPRCFVRLVVSKRFFALFSPLRRSTSRLPVNMLSGLWAHYLPARNIHNEKLGQFRHCLVYAIGLILYQMIEKRLLPTAVGQSPGKTKTKNPKSENPIRYPLKSVFS